MSPMELVGTIQQIGKLSVHGSKLCSAGPEHHLVSRARQRLNSQVFPYSSWEQKQFILRQLSHMQALIHPTGDWRKASRALSRPLSPLWHCALQILGTWPPQILIPISSGQGNHWAWPGVPFSTLRPRYPQEEKRGNHKAHVLCYQSLRDHCGLYRTVGHCFVSVGRGLSHPCYSMSARAEL